MGWWWGKKKPEVEEQPEAAGASEEPKLLPAPGEAEAGAAAPHEHPDGGAADLRCRGSRSSLENVVGVTGGILYPITGGHQAWQPAPRI